MPRCTHQGCSKEFSADSPREDGECSFHPGGPVFHEGLKSWSCCNEINKPVMEFDQFIAIPGCTKGQHTSAPAKQPATTTTTTITTASPPTVAPTTTTNGVETYGVPSSTTTSTPSITPARTPAPTAASTTPKEKPEERDEDGFVVEKGMRCRRRACGYVASGDGQADRGECRYHPGAPIFHEGSKGYLCCKRRVLDFDDFLSMPGCRTAVHSHLFSVPRKDDNEEELVDCRVDHYQTPGEVIVSAFAKGADKEKSTVKFDIDKIHLDLYLPSSKRVSKTIDLYGDIDPERSTFKVLGTKVEMTLKKPSPCSWSLLSKPSNGAAPPPGYALTFGVGGRTGTVGGKEMVLEQGVRR